MTKRLPHHVIEQHAEFMQRKFKGDDPRFPVSADAWMRRFYREDAWYAIRGDRFYETLGNSVVFDATDLVSRITNEDYRRTWHFAATLMSEGSFVLPFPDVYVVTADETSVRLIQDDMDGSIYSYPMGELKFQKDDGSTHWADTIVLGVMSGFHRIKAILDSAVEVNDSNSPDVATFLGDIGQKYFLGFDRDKGDDPELKVMRSVIDYSALACVCLSSLMSPLTAVTQEEAPTKLNKARALKGRPPIAQKFTIALRDRTALRNTLATGRTHASPEPHWRRGHIRRTHGKLIPVVPHVVGASGADVSNIGRKMYEMTCQRLNRNPPTARS